MTHILLISDTERVKRVFESLVEKDSVQLRTATTLVQADQELSAQLPEFVFVQSRVSGFSGEIVLRYLNKTLPKEAKVVLLAGDAEEMKQLQKQAELCLDLTLDEEDLAGAIEDILAGVSRPRQDAAPDSSPPAQHKQHPRGGLEPRVGAAKKADAAKAPGPGTEKPKKKQPKSPDHREPQPADPAQPERGAVSAVEEPKTSQPKVPDQTVPPSAEPPPAEQQPEESGEAYSRSFAEIMRRASAQEPQNTPLSFDVAKRNDPAPHAGWAPQPGLPDPPDPEPHSGPVSSGGFTSGEPIADALRRAEEKKKSPRWLFFALALAFVAAVSVFTYVAGTKTPPPQPAPFPRTVSGPGRLSSHPPPAVSPAPVLPVPATSAAQSGKNSPAKAAAVPVGKKVTKPAATPPARPVVPPATENGAKAVGNHGVGEKGRGALPGLTSLPPIVSETKFDPVYGKAHPGWERFLGTRVEFKVFKEKGLYRALQVLERNGEPIPDQLFKRILLEFGRVDRYQVKSTVEKGRYLVEQGVTKGDAAITIYRNKSDHRMKAFVLYYR